MALVAPGFWFRKRGWQALALAPVAGLYGAISGRRMSEPPRYRSAVPVLCVGNFTLGGAGKTPTVLALGDALARAGHTPFVITRGYGGRIKGPHRVDPLRDQAADTGDEALVLARRLPTIIAADRPAGARRAEADGATVILLDDGFQNPKLSKDFSLIVVDGATGIGNACVFPAGPLRADMQRQWPRVHAILIMGDGAAGAAVAQAASARGIPVFYGALAVDAIIPTPLAKDARVVAYAGIGRPEKFFATCRQAGLAVAADIGFPDHHTFTATDVAMLLAARDRHSASLITTEKDLVRIDRATPHGRALLDASHALTVTLALNDATGLMARMASAISAFSQPAA